MAQGKESVHNVCLSPMSIRLCTPAITADAAAAAATTANDGSNSPAASAAADSTAARCTPTSLGSRERESHSNNS